MSEVAVAILHYAFDDLTWRCLDSCYEHLGVDVPILVLDNGSPQPFVRRPQDMVMVGQMSRAGSFAEGWNACALYGHRLADYVWVLNNDVVLTRFSLPPLLEAMADPQVAVAAPMYSQADGHAFMRLPVAPTEENLVARRHLPAEEREFVDITAWLVRGQVLDTVGYLPEYEGHSWGCDVDYCRELIAAGRKVVFCPAAFIWHEGAETYSRLDGGREGYHEAARKEWNERTGNR